MKKKGSAILSCVAFVFVALFSKAQSNPSIIAPTDVVEPSTTYKAYVKVTNFDDIVGVSFTMNWDSTVLNFRAIEGFVFGEDTQIDNFFGRNNTSRGMLSFLWYDAALRGFDLADSTAIFSVIFDVIGNSGSTTGLTFTDDLADRIVAVPSGETPADFLDGLISVGTSTSVNIINTAPDKIQVKDFYPNPFSDFTQMTFDLKVPTAVRLLIKNMKGQTVHEEQQYFSSGVQNLRLTKDKFPESGAYQIFLVAPDFTVMQKLIFLRG